jgi:hypothetical protein
MSRKGPVITLIAGFATASVLIGLSMNATAEETEGYASGDKQANDQADKPADKPSSQAAKPQNQNAAIDKIEASYAGEVNGGNATVAIAVKKGQAVAYLCDGSELEAWMRGTVSDGNLKLTGEDGASLTGTYDKTKAAGSVTAGGKQWEFSAQVAKAPSGLYRATAQVRNAPTVVGWIQKQDGSQTGVANIAGKRTAAPVLNTSDRSATINGERVQAEAVTGATDF